MMQTKTPSTVKDKRSSGPFFQKNGINANAPFIQPKLTVGPVDDVYEREADAVADKVMRMSNNSAEHIQPKISPVAIQRKCVACEEEEHIQRKEDSTAEEQEAPLIVSDALGQGGNPLDNNTRSAMENHFGYDFSQVKIHTNTVAAKSAASINALAYTSGNNIVFNEGQYSPGSSTGNRLIAHELTHVVQQNGSSSAQVQRSCGREIASVSDCTVTSGDIYSYASTSDYLYLFDVNCDDFRSGESGRFVATLSGIHFPSTVAIHGFSSEEGSPEFNIRLSCARAHAAANLLSGTHPQRASLHFVLYAHGATPGGRPDHRSVVISQLVSTVPPPPPPPPVRVRHTTPGCTETSPGVIPIRRFIQYIETIEHEFAGESPQHVLSMIRRMYYGGELFDRLLPDAPRGVLRRTVCTDSEGTERPQSTPGVICQTTSEREHYSADAEDAISHLSVHANENAVGDNPSPYIFANGECIDAGHLLLAIDALLHPRTGFPYLDQGLPAIDPANWAADVGIGMVWYEEHVRNGRASTDAIGAPPGSYINEYYRISAPITDLLGDIDAFDMSTMMASGQLLSQVLRTFYVSESGGSPRMDHFRWISFVTQNGFTYTRSGNTITWTPATIALVERRVSRFADVWAYRTDRLAVALTRVPNQTWPHIHDFVTLFLDQVKAGFEEELIHNP